MEALELFGGILSIAGEKIGVYNIKTIITNLRKGCLLAMIN